MWGILRPVFVYTLLKTNDVPFPKVGYVGFREGT